VTNSEEKVYIITGLPRSGTSVVAGIVQRLGIPMNLPEHRLRQDGHNATGYHENLAFVNPAVAATNTRSFLQILDAMNKTNSNHSFLLDGNKLYTQAVARMFTAYDIWGVKDPRFCIPELLTELIYVLEEFTARENIKVVLTARNMKSVANSLIDVIRKIDEIELVFDGVYNTILKSYGNLVDMIISHNLDFHVINYDNLVVSPVSEIHEISEFCGVKTTQKAIDFVDQKLKRF